MSRDVNESGAAAVEFACCLPLLVLILSGLWEVGRITEVQGILSNSAREAARDALQPLAMERADVAPERRRFNEAPQAPEIRRDMLAHGLKLRREVCASWLR